jgi:hypothetical protein
LVGPQAHPSRLLATKVGSLGRVGAGLFHDPLVATNLVDLVAQGRGRLEILGGDSLSHLLFQSRQMGFLGHGELRAGAFNVTRQTSDRAALEIGAARA